MTEKTEYITASIELLEKRDELNSDELAVLCNLKKFMYRSDHQPAFAVGEYYVILNVIYKVTEIVGDTVKILSLHPATGELCKEDFKLSTATEHTDKPATAEQIAEFKKAEYFSSKGRKLNEFDYGDKVYVPAVASGIIKSIDKGSVFIIELADGTEIHFDGSRYKELALLKTAEELQEVGNND